MHVSSKLCFCDTLLKQVLSDAGGCYGDILVMIVINSYGYQIFTSY